MKSAREMVWQTSNMEYGRFYSLTTEEEQRKLAGEREGRCEVLTKTLIKCRKQLGLMRLRDTSPDPESSDGFDPPTASYFQAHLQRLNKASRHSARASKSTYSDHQPEEAALKSTQTISNNIILPPPTDQLLRLVQSNTEKCPSPVEITGEIRRASSHSGRVDPTGIEEDTKQLEWILNRLADKLQPLTNGAGLPVLKFTPSKPKPVHRVKQKHIQRPKPSRNQCKPPKSQPKSDRSTEGPRLPPYCRYGFYRYYGYAGQGAKTSWCHNLPLGQKPPYGKRTKGLFKY